MWIVLLGHLRQENLNESRVAWQHACRAHELLSPGLDTSFLATFKAELQSLQPGDDDIARLVDEISEVLRARETRTGGR